MNAYPFHIPNLLVVRLSMPASMLQTL